MQDKINNVINFFDNILFLDSFEDNKKVYNMFVDYLKKGDIYELSMNIKDNDIDLINTKYEIDNIKKGSIVIKDIINLVTLKYNNDLIIDVKELDNKNNCIKFGRRKYTSKN